MSSTIAPTPVATAIPDFAPPGPGTWLLDAVHFPRPVSRYQSQIHPSNTSGGFREIAQRYGLVIDTLDLRIINGFAYFAMAPAPGEEIPARFESAEKAFATKLWRDDAARWENEIKPAAIRAHLELQAVDPDTLSDGHLLAHLDRCHEHQKKMIRQHHAMNGAAFIPIGDLMHHVEMWTGLPPSSVVPLVRGRSPESAGSFLTLDALVAALHAAPDVAALLDIGDGAAAVINRLRLAPGDVGVAANAYLDIVGYRLLDSLDSAAPCALEVPEVLVEGIRVAVEGGGVVQAPVSDDEVAAIRNLVPEEHRPEFDELLDEARMTSHMRDERGLYSDVWAGGIMRRALLSAGRRLVESGHLHAASHLIEGGYAEIRELVAGRPGPSADELADRATYRATVTIADVPPFLGEVPGPPPSLEGLPPGTARAMAAIGIAIDALFGGGFSFESESTVIRGMGVSAGSCTGTARVVSGPSDFARIELGDVLVAVTTTESFNIVLPLLGALVTDTGGMLSHAAIVSRECGIPGVVACGDATRLIADGARVRVDGTTGEIEVL